MEWQGKAGESKGYEMQGVALICKGNAGYSNAMRGSGKG
jgi:hypothetical protein